MQSTVDEALQLLVDLASEMVGGVWSASPRTADCPRDRGTVAKADAAQEVGYGISLEDPPTCRPRHRLSQAAAINGHPSIARHLPLAWTTSTVHQVDALMDVVCPASPSSDGMRTRDEGRRLPCQWWSIGWIHLRAGGRVERLRTPTVIGRPRGSPRLRGSRWAPIESETPLPWKRGAPRATSYVGFRSRLGLTPSSAVVSCLVRSGLLGSVAVSIDMSNMTDVEEWRKGLCSKTHC